MRCGLERCSGAQRIGLDRNGSELALLALLGVGLAFMAAWMIAMVGSVAYDTPWAVRAMAMERGRKRERE